MASLVCISFLSFFLFLVISSASHQRHSSLTSSKLPDPQSQSQLQPPIPSTLPEIHQACNATRFRQICESSLTQSNHLPSDPTPLQILQSAIKLSSDNLNIARSMVQTILDSADNNRNRTMASKSCLEVLRYSEYRISLVDDALPRGKVKDARAWMSAALAYQSGCLSGLKYVNDTSVVVDTMTFLDSLTRLSSNALSMMVSYDIFGNETETWRPPMTESDGFWEAPGSDDKKGLGFWGGLPMNLMPEAIVCKNGGNGCNYKTVQEAVNAAPDNATSRFVIHIKEGVYAEKVRVPFEKKNVIFLGDGVGKTVITGSSNVGQPGMTTYDSSTVGILGDGFMAKDLTIENTAGAGAHQAVAFRSDSDMSVLENCEFVGNQDTLYAHSLRQFYKSCRIVGNVDFIFGNSASFFQDCKILVTPREEKPEAGETNVITAQGRTDPAQSTGFVFHNCVVNGTDEYVALYKSKPQVHKNFLGRPWKEYSRTVFIQSEFAALITPQGWMPWSDDFALKTLYYGEFENSGPGSNMNQRVPWSRTVPADHVSTYSVQNFIQGGDWIPSPQHRNNNNNNNRGRVR